jgi:hypothetical protein
MKEIDFVIEDQGGGRSTIGFYRVIDSIGVRVWHPLFDFGQKEGLKYLPILNALPAKLKKKIRELQP